MDSFRTIIERLGRSDDLQAEYNGKWWTAGDIEIRGDFLVGIIGYSRVEARAHFNEVEWSWRKGDWAADESATKENLSPFAIDLRERNRWVAFAGSSDFSGV